MSNTKRSDAEALKLIREILWPPDDPEQQWSPDTLDQIAEVVTAGITESATYTDTETRQQLRRVLEYIETAKAIPSATGALDKAARKLRRILREG